MEGAGTEDSFFKEFDKLLDESSDGPEKWLALNANDQGIPFFDGLGSSPVVPSIGNTGAQVDAKVSGDGDVAPPAFNLGQAQAPIAGNVPMEFTTTAGKRATTRAQGECMAHRKKAMKNYEILHCRHCRIIRIQCNLPKCPCEGTRKLVRTNDPDVFFHVSRCGNRYAVVRRSRPSSLAQRVDPTLKIAEN